MIEKKDKKIAKKGKETQKKAKKTLNKAKETEKKVKKAKVAKVAEKKVIKVEKEKKAKKKPKELEKKAQEAKKKAQEEMRKRALEEEKKFKEAEKRIREAEKKAREAEISRVQQAEKKAREAEKLRIQQAEKKAREVEIKRVQEEQKRAKEVATKTKEEMKTMEEEKKPMEDEKKAKKVKAEAKKEVKKPVEEQRAPIEPPADFSAPKNNNGRTAVFISLIALAVAFFNFFTPPPAAAPAKSVDLGGIQDNIDAVSSSVKSMKSKIAENRKLLDSQIASSAMKFEEQKAEADKMYLASGFTDLVKEIQPSLGIYCKRATVKYLKLAKSAKAGSNTVAVDCTFDNNGSLKASIVPGSLIMIGGKGHKVIDNAVERIDNGEATTILPGTSSGKQYHVVLTEAGATNMKGGVLKMSFQAYTDKAALSMIKRKTNKEISGEQLKELTKKNHMFSFLL